MAARIALGALVGAQLALASPVYGGNATTPAGGVVYTTEVVDEYTTYCPEATTLTYNDKTYTVTKPTTLTITDCPCTIKKPVKATSTSAAPAVYTTPAGGVHYTTEVVTKLTTYCPAATTLTFNDKTYTVTKPTTLTVTDCPCTIKKPIVYTTEVVTKLTTYCPEPTTLTFNNITYTVTKPTSLTVTNCPCTITKATTLPTGTSPAKPVTTLPAKTCAEECYASYDSCRSGSYANHAACAAAYAGCLGYSPFDSNGSLVTPTACSAGATGATVPVTGTAPVAAGTTATVPGSAATTPASVPTAAAGRALPEFVLLALGALALL